MDDNLKDCVPITKVIVQCYIWTWLGLTLMTSTTLQLAQLAAAHLLSRMS